MTKQEFEDLIKLEKHFESDYIDLPAPGEKAGKPFKVLSDTTRDIFYLDTDRKGTITLTKVKLQERHQNSNTMMIRLEIDCRPHMFPDGSLSSRNHIHIFDEESENRVYNIDGKVAALFSDIHNFRSTFYDFCKICHINTNNVNIQGVI